MGFDGNKSFKKTGRRNVIPRYPPVLRDGRELRCESCGRLFTSTDALRQHVALTHTGRRPHACPICGKRYGQMYHLQAHLKLHREPRLQEFSILKHRPKPASEPTSPRLTTVGSFRVPKRLKSYTSEPTFGSFGTLQTFTIKQSESPEPNTARTKKDNRVQLPSLEDNNFVTGANKHSVHEETGTIKRDRQFDSERGTEELANIDGLCNEVDKNTRRTDSDKETLPNVDDSCNKADRKARSTDSNNEVLAERLNDVEDSIGHRDDELPLRDSHSERYTRISIPKERSAGHRSLVSFSGSTASVVSEPISLRTKAIRQRKIWDNPDYLTKGIPTVRSVRGYDPVEYWASAGNNRPRQYRREYQPYYYE